MCCKRNWMIKRLLILLLPSQRVFDLNLPELFFPTLIFWELLGTWGFCYYSSQLVMCRASVFRASGGLEPSIFWTFRASGGLGYQHFGPGRALNLSNELRAGTELLQLRNIIIFFIIWEKPKLNSLKFMKYE